MKVTFDGTLKIYLPKDFTTNEGETVEYAECYFLNEDEQELLKINTKMDLAKFEGQRGPVVVEMEEGRKPKLVSFLSRSNRRQSNDEE